MSRPEDPLRERLDWMERHVEDMHVEEPLFAALRAVLDLLDDEDPEMTFPEYQAEMRLAIDMMLPGR